MCIIMYIYSAIYVVSLIVCINISIYLSIRLSLSVRLSVCRSINLPIYLFTYLSIIFFYFTACISCGSGYVLDSTQCICNLTDICEAQSPCVNGICILLSQPDEYSCNCTGTGFHGPNCGKLRNICILNSS